ncbi:hypothetical protein OS175_12205 [Marinicella sp. S1101]|uniref:hypothetical protein n=1 Tax=Marinicella marina TaxID=2996016 RepID=UPI002260B436|nr:hypothetical protein [Marinicella marina]MCX7554647.1 hypothetical protein [Marinicella marina]MDJ1140712.1 hypothetical protein [Marinicella marina]
MKNRISKSVFLLIMMSTTLALQAQNGAFVTETGSGVLDAVVTADDSVVFNGIKYKYVLNTKASTLAIDESEPQPLKINQLKVGENYYFDKISFDMKSANPKFREITFITDTKPMEIE